MTKVENTISTALDTMQAIPGLAHGIEFLGEFEGSAFHDRPCLLRRADGEVLQVSPLLYAVASHLNEALDDAEIAERVTAAVKYDVSADNIRYLVAEKLVPLGVAGNEEAVAKEDPLLALKFRVGVVPERLHRVVTTALRPLFARPAVVLVLSALASLDIWIVSSRRTDIVLAGAEILQHPAQLLLISCLVISAGMFHEIGHATGARYGGATPGTMGIGLYLIWPVFFTDVSDSYRLNKLGRLRTDLGGVYFNAVALVGCASAYLATGFKPLLIFVVLSHFQILYQFIPFVRLDGYWILSDLIGVPNPFAYVGPVIQRIIRRKNETSKARLLEIKPWARRVITAWVVVTVLVLAVNAFFLGIFGPRMLAATWNPAQDRVRGLVADFSHGHIVDGLNSVMAFALLVISDLAVVLISGLILQRLLREIISRRAKQPLLASALACLVLAFISFQVAQFNSVDRARHKFPQQVIKSSSQESFQPVPSPTPQMLAAPSTEPPKPVARALTHTTNRQRSSADSRTKPTTDQAKPAPLPTSAPTPSTSTSTTVVQNVAAPKPRREVTTTITTYTLDANGKILDVKTRVERRIEE